MSGTDEEAIGAALNRTLEMFAAICADPDNRELAGTADAALAELSRLLRASGAEGAVA